MKFAVFVLLMVAFPGFLWAAPKSRRSLNLPTSTITGYDQRECVNKHNKYRRYQDAADMKYMTWDQELADAAQAHVDKCVFQHGTLSWPGMSFDTIGQNMFFSDFFAVDPGFMISKWYNEVSFYDYDTDTCQQGKGCGHFLQVVWANTDKVGCAKKLCETMDFPDEQRTVPNALFFTCNYNPASFNYHEQPYQTGELCTKCASGKQWCEDGLCRDCNLLDSDELEDDCECNLQCENCGVKNEADCSCTCPAGYIGTSCETECSDLSDHCGTTWAAWTCDLPEAMATVRPKCPKMCGVCKAPTIDTNTCIEKDAGCVAKDCGPHGTWDNTQCKCICTTGHHGDTCQDACPSCFDAYTDICPTWKERCHDPAYKNFMDFTCAKTCGSCTVPEGC